MQFWQKNFRPKLRGLPPPYPPSRKSWIRHWWIFKNSSSTEQVCCHESLLLKRQTTGNYTKLPISSFTISITKTPFVPTLVFFRWHCCFQAKSQTTDALEYSIVPEWKGALFCTEELSFSFVMFQWHLSSNDRIPCLEALTQTEWYLCFCILVMSGCVVSTITLGRYLVLICLPATLFP